MKNTFIAINLSNEMKNLILKFQKELDLYVNNVHFVKKDNLHITLAFLGSISGSRLKQAIEIISAIGKDLEPFSLVLGGFGVFPEVRRAKTLWLGVDNNVLMNKFNQAICRKLSKAGFDIDERHYQPHITLARTKNSFLKKETVKFLLDKFKNINLEKIELNRFSIMESNLRPEGTIYHVIKNINLKRKNVL